MPRLTEPQYSQYLKEFVRLQERDGMFFFLRVIPCDKKTTAKFTSAMTNEWFYKPFFLN